VAVLVHHGGLSTAYAGLASGTPQLLATWNLEHLVTARGVARFGCARVTMQNQQRKPDAMAEALHGLAIDEGPRQAAQAAARIVAQRKRESPLSSILAACDELLAA
jgi:UDP:flavonoid glycosyltransferase YjiC (YdhE family)